MTPRRTSEQKVTLARLVYNMKAHGNTIRVVAEAFGISEYYANDLLAEHRMRLRQREIHQQGALAGPAGYRRGTTCHVIDHGKKEKRAEG